MTQHTEPPTQTNLCPARWVKNRGVHCTKPVDHPRRHTNTVVFWPDSEAEK